MLDAGFHDALKGTEPNKLRQMKTEKIVEYEQYFAEQLPHFESNARDQKYQQQCQNRMDSLRREIQHRQASGIGKKTLTWARIAGVAAIATVVVSVAALIYSIYFSKVQPATSEPVLPTTSQQMTTPTSALPESAASSNSATPLVKPAATITPSPTTPPKS